MSHSAVIRAVYPHMLPAGIAISAPELARRARLPVGAVRRAFTSNVNRVVRLRRWLRIRQPTGDEHGIARPGV